MEDNNLYKVAIGASAGGNEALIQFFQNVPANPEVAFIIIRHISRTYKSYFSDMLAKVTSLKIVTVKGGERLEKNTIYLMPGGSKMVLKNGQLQLIERQVSEKINYAIDDFFISLSEEEGPNAIGIILSGLLNDGLKGAKAIEGKGGMIMVQDPNTACKDSMPLNVIQKDHPDFILSPDKMASTLMDYIKVSHR
jgi:two-component system CheB/CheR fusion protein